MKKLVIFLVFSLINSVFAAVNDNDGYIKIVILSCDQETETFDLEKKDISKKVIFCGTEYNLVYKHKPNGKANFYILRNGKVQKIISNYKGIQDKEKIELTLDARKSIDLAFLDNKFYWGY